MTEQVAGDHYEKMPMQPWDIIKAHDLDYWAATIVKYVLRAGHKPGTPKSEDLKKAAHFLNEYIKLTEDAEKTAADADPILKKTAFTLTGRFVPDGPTDQLWKTFFPDAGQISNPDDLLWPYGGGSITDPEPATVERKYKDCPACGSIRVHVDPITGELNRHHVPVNGPICNGIHPGWYTARDKNTLYVCPGGHNVYADAKRPNRYMEHRTDGEIIANPGRDVVCEFSGAYVGQTVKERDDTYVNSLPFPAEEDDAPTPVVMEIHVKGPDADWQALGHTNRSIGEQVANQARHKTQ